MQHLFSRVPSAALKTEIDGHVYAHIPHKLARTASRVIEDNTAPRMVRFAGLSYVKNGEAYVWFAAVGDAINLQPLPFAVTRELRDASGRIVTLLSSEEKQLAEFRELDPISMTRELMRLRCDRTVSGPLLRACVAHFNAGQ